MLVRNNTLTLFERNYEVVIKITESTAFKNLKKTQNVEQILMCGVMFSETLFKKFSTQRTETYSVWCTIIVEDAVRKSEWFVKSFLKYQLSKIVKNSKLATFEQL